MTLTDLIKKMSEDKAFEAKYRELISIDAVVEQAAVDGYSITAEDVEALRREAEYRESGRTELSDEMMEDVAGGTMVGIHLPSSWLLVWLRSLFSGNQEKYNVSEVEIRENPPTNTSGVSATTLVHNPANPSTTTTLPYNPANPPTITTLPHDPSGQPIKVVKL